MNKDNTNNIKITEERSLIKIEPDVERKREIMNRIKKDDERMDWRDSLAKDYRQFVELNSSRSNISQNDAHDGRTRYLSPWMNRHYDNERCFPERYQRRGYY